MTQKIDFLTRLQESKGRQGGDEAWWTELCCVCACGKDCSIISCYQLILNVYRHFTHSIYYSHTLNSIWGLDMGDTHAPIHSSLHTTVLKNHNRGYRTVLILVNKVPHGTSPSFQTWLSLCSWKKHTNYTNGSINWSRYTQFSFKLISHQSESISQLWFTNKWHLWSNELLRNMNPFRNSQIILELMSLQFESV